MELWARLSGLLPRYETAASSPDAELGHLLEPFILARYAHLEGVEVVPGNAGIDTPGYTVPGLPWHAHLDGWCVTRSHPIECKAPRDLDPDRWGAAGTDELPPEHGVQVTCQIAIAHARVGSDRGDLAALARAPRGKAGRVWAIYRVRHNHRRVQRIASEVERWIDRYVHGAECPPVDGTDSCGSALRRIWRPVDERVVVASASELEDYAQLVSCRSAIEELQGRAEESRQRIQLAMRDATALHDQRGAPLLTWRSNKNGVRSFRMRGE